MLTKCEERKFLSKRNEQKARRNQANVHKGAQKHRRRIRKVSHTHIHQHREGKLRKKNQLLCTL